MEVARFRCDRRKECPDSNGSRRRREGPAEFENFAAHGSVTRSESRTTENREGVVVVESSVVSDRLHTHDCWPCWENRCRSVDLFRDARKMPRALTRAPLCRTALTARSSEFSILLRKKESGTEACNSSIRLVSSNGIGMLTARNRPRRCCRTPIGGDATSRIHGRSLRSIAARLAA